MLVALSQFPHAPKWISLTNPTGSNGCVWVQLVPHSVLHPGLVSSVSSRSRFERPDAPDQRLTRTIFSLGGPGNTDGVLVLSQALEGTSDRSDHMLFTLPLYKEPGLPSHLDVFGTGYELSWGLRGCPGHAFNLCPHSQDSTGEARFLRRQTCPGRSGLCATP